MGYTRVGRLGRRCRNEHLDGAVLLANHQRGQRFRSYRQLMRQHLAGGRKRRRMARAAQPVVGRVEPQSATLVRAHPGDGFGLAVDTTNEPDHRTDIEGPHDAVGHVGAGRDPHPASGVRRELPGPAVAAVGDLSTIDQRAIDGYRRHRGRRGGRRPDDDVPAGRSRLRRRLGGAVLLRGEPTVQIGEEFLPRSITAQPCRLQIDRRPNLRGFEVVGPERLWATATQQVVDVPAQRTRVHDPPSSLTCAASRNARC